MPLTYCAGATERTGKLHRVQFDKKDVVSVNYVVKLAMDCGLLIWSHSSTGWKISNSR